MIPLSDRAALVERLLDILLPAGGAVANLVEVYVDESGDDGRSTILCVAGYIFHKEAAIGFTKDWGAVLQESRLPYFRMSACAHGNHPFDGRCVEERTKIEKLLIQHIHRYAVQGFAVSIDVQEYSQIMPPRDDLGDAYSFCLRQVLTIVKNWANRVQFDGDIAYFFESGHKSQGQANAIMSGIFKSPLRRALYRSVGYGFYDKEKVLPLQSGDMMAWQWFTDTKRKRSGRRETRQDLLALIRQQDTSIDFTADMLRDLAWIVMAHDGGGGSLGGRSS